MDWPAHLPLVRGGGVSLNKETRIFDGQEKIINYN